MILRDGYNHAAKRLLKSLKNGKGSRQLAQAGAKSGKKSNGKSGKGSTAYYVEPYSPLYIMSNEELTDGTI
jgi:hypothetical protein